jgi:hypothetical protein
LKNFRKYFINWKILEPWKTKFKTWKTSFFKTNEKIFLFWKTWKNLWSIVLRNELFFASEKLKNQFWKTDKNLKNDKTF